MYHTIKIKVCGMREPENIRQLIKVHPDFIGFIFYPKSKRFIGEKIDKRILSLLPADIKKIGVVVNETLKTLVSIQKENHLDYLQLHGNESPELCLALKEKKIKVIKAFGMNDNFDFTSVAEYNEACDYFLFDTKCETKGGSGKKFKWEILDRYNLQKPFFLSGGIGPENADDILPLKSHTQIFAVDINSRFEIEPGMKNIELVDTFIKKIKTNKS